MSAARAGRVRRRPERRTIGLRGRPGRRRGPGSRRVPAQRREKARAITARIALRLVEAGGIPARNEDVGEEGRDDGGLDEPPRRRGLVEAREPPGPRGERDRDGRERAGACRVNRPARSMVPARPITALPLDLAPAACTGSARPKPRGSRPCRPARRPSPPSSGRSPGATCGRGASEGGISVIAWYALVGVMLGVATLIVVQAVMIGFREEFTDRILGANAHVTVYYATEPDANGTPARLIPDYDDLAARLAAVPGVTHAAPLVRGQVMVAANGRASGVEVIGTRAADLATVPLVAHPEAAAGDLGRLRRGHRHRDRGGARPRGRGRRHGDADRAARGWTRPSGPSRGSATTRWSMSSGSGASTSTGRGSTCRSPRRRASSTARGRRTRSR